MKRFLTVIVCVGLIFSFFVSASPVSADSNWWSTSWAWRKRINFNNKDQNENLVNFPVLVKLNSGFDFEKAQSSGQDIRFIDSDNSTQLSYEIEKWDSSTKDAVVWVKVPQIDASTDTDFIYMYYGNPTASDAQSVNSTWDTTFKFVQHLGESGPTTYDSTSNGTNGTFAGTGVPVSTTGKIGNGLLFNGTGSFVSFFGDGNTTFFGFTGDFSASAWINKNSSSQAFVFGQYTSLTVGSAGWGIRSLGPPWDGLCNILMNDATTTNGYSCSKGSSLNTWHYIELVRRGTTLEWYVDGGLSEIITSSAVTDLSLPPGSKFRIGKRGNGNDPFPGIIDEVRISSTSRSASWIAAEYKSGNDQFNITGSQESQSTATVSLSSSTISAPLGKTRLTGRVTSINSNLLVGSVDCSTNGGGWVSGIPSTGGFDSIVKDFYCDFTPWDNGYLLDGYGVRVRAKVGNFVVSDDNYFFQPFLINNQGNESTASFSPSISFSINKGRFSDIKSFISNFRVMVKDVNYKGSDWTTYIDNIPVDFESIKNLDTNLRKKQYEGKITNGNGVYEDTKIKVNYSDNNSTLEVTPKTGSLSPKSYQYKIVAVSKSGNTQETDTKTLTIQKRQIQTNLTSTTLTQPTTTSPIPGPTPTPAPQTPQPTPTPKPKTCFLFWCW